MCGKYPAQLIGIVVVVGLLVLAWIWLAGTETSDTPKEPASGMLVYIDPNTGEFAVPPPGTEFPGSEPDILGGEPEEPVEIQGTTEAGGVMVHVKDPFYSETPHNQSESDPNR